MGVSTLIVSALRRLTMALTVNLDREACGGAVEIQDARADGMLATNSDAEGVPSDVHPQARFRRRHPAAHGLGAANGAGIVFGQRRPLRHGAYSRRATSPSQGDGEEKS